MLRDYQQRAIDQLYAWFANNKEDNHMNIQQTIKILRSGLTTQQEQEEIADLLDNNNPQKDLLFSEWYDSLEGTKSQGFAYRAWCAGWAAALKPVKCDCLTPKQCDFYDQCLRKEK